MNTRFVVCRGESAAGLAAEVQHYFNEYNVVILNNLQVVTVDFGNRCELRFYQSLTYDADTLKSVNRS
jgi:hypothetical protein